MNLTIKNKDELYILSSSLICKLSELQDKMNKDYDEADRKEYNNTVAIYAKTVAIYTKIENLLIKWKRGERKKQAELDQWVERILNETNEQKIYNLFWECIGGKDIETATYVHKRVGQHLEKAMQSGKVKYERR